MSKSSAALYSHSCISCYLEMPAQTISPVPHKHLDLYTVHVSVLIMIHRQYLRAFNTKPDINFTYCSLIYAKAQMNVTCAGTSFLLLFYRLYELDVYNLSCISGKTLCTMATRACKMVALRAGNAENLVAQGNFVLAHPKIDEK
jgi:hypothetical protein